MQYNFVKLGEMKTDFEQKGSRSFVKSEWIWMLNNSTGLFSRMISFLKLKGRTNNWTEPRFVLPVSVYIRFSFH